MKQSSCLFERGARDGVYNADQERCVDKCRNGFNRKAFRKTVKNYEDDRVHDDDPQPQREYDDGTEDELYNRLDENGEESQYHRDFKKRDEIRVQPEPGNIGCRRKERNHVHDYERHDVGEEAHASNYQGTKNNFQMEEKRSGELKIATCYLILIQMGFCYD